MRARTTSTSSSSAARKLESAHSAEWRTDAMRLTPSQIERFRAQGFLVLPELFSRQEIAVLRDALPALYAEDTPANIREKRSGEVRTAMGLPLRHPGYRPLVPPPPLLHPPFPPLLHPAYLP